MSETCTKIRRFQLSSTEWTAIVAPSPCNWWEIINCDASNPVRRCSDPNNDQSWHDIPGGGSYALIAPVSGPRRYEPGDAISYLKAYADPPGVACVEFIL